MPRNWPLRRPHDEPGAQLADLNEAQEAVLAKFRRRLEQERREPDLPME